MLPLPASQTDLIDIETFLAEVPSDFQPGTPILDHNTLRRQPGVRVLNIPRLCVSNGSTANLTIADIQVATPPPSFNFRVEPTLDRGNVAYDLEIAYRLSPEAGTNGSAKLPRASRFGGVASQGMPQPFDLGPLGNGRRLMAIMVFRPASPGDSSNRPPSSAAVSNPEFQQVISLKDTDRNGFVFFDFETGRFLKPPMNVTFNPASPDKLSIDSALRDWIAQEDVDIMFALEGSSWHQLQLDMDGSGIPLTTRLDTLSPEALYNFVSRLAQRPLRTNTAGQVTASTYYRQYTDQTRMAPTAFRTRKGTCGVVQCVGLSDPPGVKIRYRFYNPSPQ